MNKQKWQQFFRKLLFWRPVRKVLHYSRLLIIPGFQSVPVFDVLVFFIKGLTKGALKQRSAAISFHFFLSLFPLILFLVTLLPFLNLDYLTEKILETVQEFAPNSVGDYISTTITDLMNRKHKGLMTIGFFSSIFVASSGVNALLLSLNASYHNLKKRSVFKRRLISVALVIGIAFGIIVSMTLIIFAKRWILYLFANNVIKNFLQYHLLRVLKWVIIVFVVYLLFAMVYYVAPVDKRGYKFFSAGASLGTALFILFSQGFNWYIIHFSHYNALYGSIGAMIIFLLWIYLNSYILLIGFELNVAIADAYTQGHARKNLNRNKNKDSLRISRSARSMFSWARAKKDIKRFYIRKYIPFITRLKKHFHK
ncbi:MAG: YihY/virulence factor BrkB family protein [Bacteroidota bacterium]|nr:YihY/virulence factor BrkB family protein [Bacteroidota bacterium]